MSARASTHSLRWARGSSHETKYQTRKRSRCGFLVNGQERQLARTNAMLNGVSELVSYLSQVCTLEPGDLIATGNPDHPDFQVALKPGDRMRAEIEGIGALHVGVAAV